MKLNNLYGWWIGKEATFVNSFNDNQQLRDQAHTFWKQLEGGTLFYFIAFIAVAALFAYLYFKPFNEMPGRHFRPRYWVIFGLIAMGVSFGLTLLIAQLSAPHMPKGYFHIELMLSLANMVYTGLTYFIVMSFLFWNNVFGKTNAYKLIKL